MPRSIIPAHLTISIEEIDESQRQRKLFEEKLRLPMEFYREFIRETDSYLSLKLKSLPPDEFDSVTMFLLSRAPDKKIAQVRTFFENIKEGKDPEENEVHLRKRTDEIPGIFAQWWFGVLYNPKISTKDRIPLDELLCPPQCHEPWTDQLEGRLIGCPSATIKLLQANAKLVKDLITKDGELVVFKTKTMNLVIKRDDKGYYLE